MRKMNIEATTMSYRWMSCVHIVPQKTPLTLELSSTDGTWTEARRLVDSKLLRIFLSSDDLARIVGIVSARDILSQVLDQLAWQQGIRQKEKRPWWWKVDWDGRCISLEDSSKILRRSTKFTN